MDVKYGYLRMLDWLVPTHPLFDWFGISCMTTDIFLQNRLIQTSQTGGQWYNDTSPFSIPWLVLHYNIVEMLVRDQHSTLLDLFTSQAKNEML